MITVQAFYKSSGNAASSVQVNVWQGYSGPYSGYTDSQGEAHFSSLSPGEYEVSVNGTSVYKGRIEGRQVVYI